MTDDNDDRDKNHHGFWYWMIIAQPEVYFLAKSLGEDASKQADAAMEDIGVGFAIVLVLATIGGGIWLVGRLLGFW